METTEILARGMAALAETQAQRDAAIEQLGQYQQALQGVQQQLEQATAERDAAIAERDQALHAQQHAQAAQVEHDVPDHVMEQARADLAGDDLPAPDGPPVA